MGSKYQSANGKSITSQAAIHDPSVPLVPYMNAQVFPLNFTNSILVRAVQATWRLEKTDKPDRNRPVTSESNLAVGDRS